MLDFSVSLNGPAAPNTTLLHWILAGLSSPNNTTTLTSHQGEIASYFPPGPPPGQTHTYGVFLYPEPAKFAIPADYVPFFANLSASPLNRIGFNLTHFVEETGLGEPVAADWFLVSTPNVTMSSSAVATGAATATTTTIITGTGTGTGATSGSGSIVSTSAAPLATASKSGATKMGLEMMLVALGGLGLLAY
jgi:phosphatidylethanolamine-binding protein